MPFFQKHINKLFNYKKLVIRSFEVKCIQKNQDLFLIAGGKKIDILFNPCFEFN